LSLKIIKKEEITMKYYINYFVHTLPMFMNVL